MSDPATLGRSASSNVRRRLAQGVAAVICVGIGFWSWQGFEAHDAPADPARTAPAAGSPGAVSPARTPASPAPAIPAQQASIAATMQIIVARNDTMDRIFRRLALDTSDLAKIRELPGIRQSLDFLKPGDSIQVTHAAGSIHALMRKVSETQTLKVVRAPTVSPLK